LRYGYIDSDESNANPIDVESDPRKSKWSAYEAHNGSLMDPPKEYVSGLKQFQQRYGLPVTGELDATTSALLTAPRCGNPDQPIFNRTRMPQFHVRQRTPVGEASASERRLRRTKRYLIGDEKMKWTKKKLTWQIRNYPSHSLSRVRTHAVFQHTFNMWSKVVDLDFVEEKDYSKSPDIEIIFGAEKHGDSIPFDGPGGVLAHAFYPTPDDVYSFAGDAHFDDAETWNDGPHKGELKLLTSMMHQCLICVLESNLHCRTICLLISLSIL
uniref:ZnMc domain-containing protein n=1 Tax=Echinostoma caproni TaxID=27848 RepID=A0A183B684_9TREM